MSLRSKSVKHKTPSKPSPPKSSKSSTKSSPKPPTRTSAAWDPPPLFQAYPQAIKHAQLSASTLSADSILRISNHKRNNSLRDEIAQTRAIDGQDEGAMKKTEKARAKHRRQISGSISKADWTQKIFVLVTSGYLLQYSGEGSFDRLPEKMMQLGKDSVAFASDVIPGKHWVLQISQAMDADGTPAADSRSLLSRLTFRGADYRRSCTSLLLVLNSAEDMDSWIAVVRREIEALGGKKHVSETGKPKPDEKVMQLKAQPSHRYLVHKDHDQHSNPTSPQSLAFGPPPWVKEKENKLQQELEDAASALIRPHSSSIRPSTGHRSITNSIKSHDGRQLDNLRDSTHRFSYVSSGQRTLITSQGSSPATSPTRESIPSFDDFPPKISMEDVRPRPNAAAINERRRSMQAMQIPVLEAQQPIKRFRHSTYSGQTKSVVRDPSPSTPNFSVPNSSSKRYSTVKSPVRIEYMPNPVKEAPPLPLIVTTTPNRSRDSILKGTRKTPPAALNVTRPLSPVKDAASPKRLPTVYTPTESSFKMVQQIKPSIIDIPPRSPGTLPSPSEDAPPPPHRKSSLTPLNSIATSHIDFQFPRRFSSMQKLRDMNEQLLEPPFRYAPLPAAALTTPLPPSPFVLEDQFQEKYEVTEAERENLSPLPVLANTKSKVRRPASMQIRMSSGSPNPYITPKSAGFPALSSPDINPKSGRPFSITSTASSGTLNQGQLSPAPMSMMSPAFQRIKNQKALANRRSMPTLVNGPPPAPPPDCALPPLPPIRSSIGMRNPVKV